MSIREILLAAIQNAEVSANEISRQTGIPQPTISRFLQGKTDMRISAADKLAAFFKLSLLPSPSEPTTTKAAKSSRKKSKPKS